MTGPEQLILNTRVRHRAVGDDGVLVHLDNGEVIVVNEVGLFVVQQLVSPMTQNALIDAVVSTFSVDPGQARADVDTYLSQLSAQQLIDTHVEP